MMTYQIENLHDGIDDKKEEVDWKMIRKWMSS